MGKLADPINNTYNQMTEATVVDRPLCKAKPIDKAWVILGLRSEETEDLVEPLYFAALEADARGDEELALRLLNCMQPLSVIAQALAYASAGYKSIERTLVELQTMGLVHPESVAGVVTALGISGATTELYGLIVSILESVDRERIARDAEYASEKLDTVRDLLDFGRAVMATGRTSEAWLYSARLLQAAKKTPTAMLSLWSAHGSVS